ncbi:YhgE/Pip domain-containing protein [Bifidobacterium biavatii]|uniref:Membrane protein n=1 Tax=Bifidobacterium biavatii DSM 23969 TaxID=1437608 RepID=A0A086ZNL3_9BIFI|nr:YhgE/Pip domain-containing protein [Bifidobacterium biavatii]KFI48113.1 membrane protein [Bifidobacterium biavatii DSM 23969]
MRTVWTIFTRDLRRILRNPVALVVTLGVAIIPSLYAWFNILANWDPYSATGNLQVAIANEDKGTKSDLVGSLNAGKQVVSQLKKNSSLGWRFVDEEQAISGVQSGEYYAAIVLPKDFSESLVNSVTGSSKRPSIKYYVNEKKNATAPKITDTGATTIDTQINATFVSTVANTVAKAVSAAGGELDKTTNQTQTGAINDLDTVLASLRDTQNALDSMQSTLATTKSALDKAKGNTATLRQAIAAAQKASKQSGTLLAEAQKSTQTFSTTLTGALDDGSLQLAGVAASANAAAGSVTGTFNTAQIAVDSIYDNVSKPLDNTAAALTNLKKALNAAGIDQDTSDPLGKRIWSQIDTVDGVITTQQSQLDTFRKDSTQFITSGKNATSSLSGAVGSASSGGLAAIAATRSSLTGTVIPSLSASLDSFATLNGTLNGTLVSLNSTLDQADGLFNQLGTTIDQTKTTLSGTQESLNQLATDVETVRADIGALDSSAAYKKIRDTLHLDDKEFGEFMSSPVSLDEKIVYPVDNYGSAVTPFYTNLALWVGGFVLIAIYKLEVDREGLEKLGRISASQAYLGRWLLLLVVGFLQALIATVGDIALGIQMTHPVLFILAGLFCSFVYINIIYALAVAFRHIGKAVAVVLVIMQIPGASGLYPIEMMPDFFRKLHPWLPFTYGINAMRGPIAGTYANHYWLDMGHLALYLPAALFVGLVVRRYAMNLNALFDRRLGDTDLMITEHNSMVNERVSLNALFGRVEEGSELHAMVKRRAHRFFMRYPKLIISGLALLAVLPFIFLVLLFVLTNKIAMLTAWIASIILIDTYLIVVEYTRESYARQLGVSAMSADEFRNVMLNGYVWLRPGGRGGAGRHAKHAPWRVPNADVALDDSPDIGEVTEELPAFHSADAADAGTTGETGRATTEGDAR